MLKDNHTQDLEAQSHHKGSGKQVLSVKYDLHLHSCLSPCGDDDMTPNNIVNMALIKELEVIALSDHNSCANCPAIMEAGRINGLLVIPGMELTTSEDIHVLCLFRTLEGAMEFDSYVNKHRILIDNRADIYGTQIIMNAQDEPIGEIPHLLINATEIDSEQVAGIVRNYGGLAMPAHVDKNANSMMQTLGSLPPDHEFTCIEFKDRAKFPLFDEKYGLSDLKHIVNSDAHYLWDISEGGNFLHTSQLSAAAIIDSLSGL